MKWPKELALFIALILVPAVVGISAIDIYNKPIDINTIRMAIYLCAKNDGLKSIQRDFWNSKTFLFQCNNTAIFNGVTIRILTPDELKQEKEQQS